MSGPIRNRLARPRGVLEVVAGYGYAAVLITHVVLATWILGAVVLEAFVPAVRPGGVPALGTIAWGFSSAGTACMMAAMDVEAVRLEDELEDTLDEGARS